jgi:hypothetical protein
MVVHNLAIFWRDQAARSLSALHFQAAAGERALSRARKLLAAFAQLSALQIYGAALDDAPLPIEMARPAPAAGSDVRLHFDYTPAKPKDAHASIKPMRFSLPGPVQDLLEAAERQIYAALIWQLLEQEVLPFLCLPDGTKAAIPPKLRKAEIAFLDAEHRPQPGLPPIESAITRTEEGLATAQANARKLKTPKTRARVDERQQRLDLLYSWRIFEQSCFEHLDELNISLPVLPAPAREIEIALFTPQKHFTNKLSQTESHNSRPNISIGEMVSLQPDQLSQPHQAITAAQQATATNLGDAMSITDSTPDKLVVDLPAKPSGDDEKLWADVPPIHFDSPAMWLTRNQLKELYQVQERSYYRWMARLHQLGLNRELLSPHDGKIKFYYRKDVETAVARLALEQPMRAVKALTPPASQASSGSVPAAAAAAHSATPALASLPLQPAPQPDLAAQLALLQHQYQLLHSEQTALRQSLANIESAFTQLQQQAIADRAHYQSQIDALRAAASASTSESAISPVLVQLNKLSAQMRRLPNRIANATPSPAAKKLVHKAHKAKSAPSKKKKVVAAKSKSKSRRR